MKKTLLVATVLAFAATAPVAYADDDAKVTGLAGGAVAGALIGGPVGAVIGGAVGLTAGAAIDNNDREVIVRKQRRSVDNDRVIVEE